MVEHFTNFQRRMWFVLAHVGVCRYFVSVTPKGKYVICKAKFGTILFWVLWTNNIFKLIYEILTYHGVLGVEVHFLDQMGIWDWLLVYGNVFFENLIWFFKYPMYENLYRQWELQEEIFRKLGRPEHVARKITKTDKINLVVYGGVCVVGTFALSVQFFVAPKYALNTYAIIPGDTPLLRIIFCIHETMFMFPAYVYQAFTMVLAESYSVSYQHILEEMNKCLEYLITQGKRPSKSKSNSKSSSSQIATPVDPEVIVPGTEYNITSLLDDYKKIMISAEFHNQWIGKIIGGAHGLNNCQFVSDVFIMIQLLKEAETDYLGVFFYVMDASFGMIMVFRMLIILSRLYPQAEEFVQGIKTYAGMNTPMRKELVKVIPTLRVVSAKIGGFTVTPESVPSGVHMLINWYICAAMWQRPTDPSRRT